MLQPLSKRSWLVGLVVAQGAVILALLLGPSAVTPVAAQQKQEGLEFPNAFAQRRAQLAELDELNEKMDRLLKLLEDGELQIRQADADTQRQ